jgi:DinB family protein
VTDERYPIGKHTPVSALSAAERVTCIEQIAAAPANFRRAVAGLNDAQLDTPYRTGGWTVRQVAHHVPDSHMNAYMRFKWGLTEHSPAIKTYEEKDWAQTPEMRAPIAMSLDLLAALHVRWVTLLRAMSPADFARTIKHPESGTRSLDTMLGLYAWHGRHHTAHVTSLRQRMGWGSGAD